MITCHIAPRMILDFWFEGTLTKATLYCKKHADTRSIEECEKYPVLSITRKGELKRHEGIPVDWGFRLTDKRKVKEIK
jgi:hypothetical protein